jgi:two-component system sensor histidine kinase RpfC
VTARASRWPALARLRGRPDSEHEMSFNRLGFALLLLACLPLMPPEDPAAALRALALWSALSVGLFVHILARPGVSQRRRFVALLLDTGFLSWYLHIGGEAHSAFVCIYLWVVFGNGFRFGLTWLHIAMGAALAGFLAVVLTTPYWHGQPHLSGGLLGGLVVLPLYAGVLIRKLSDARRAAEAASQAKSLFLANVSHELRTPLNAVIGMGGLLRDTRLDADQREMAHTIGVAARSLLELIDDILDLSRIEAGRMPVRTEAFDLAELLAEVRSLVAAQAQARGLRLGLHLAAGTPARVVADRRHLSEILVNLAGNAVKFTEAGGVSIAVRSDPAGPGRARLRFEVSDTGIGIAPEAQQRIFESFTQADPGIVTRFGGTGLGLAICRRLVGLLGGEMGLDSAPGAGSSFWFTLEAGVVASAPARVDLPGVLVCAEGAAAAHIFRDLALLGVAAERVAGFPAALERAGATGWPLIAAAAEVPEGGSPHGLALVEPRWPGVALVLVGPAAEALPRGPVRWAAATLSPGHGPEELAAALLAAAAHGGRAASRPAEAPRPAVQPRGLHVLVADDNLVNRKVAARVLERAGHAATLVADGEAALEVMEAAAAGRGRAVDLVLMDVNMPVLDGIAATKALRFLDLGAARRVPVLGLTADASPETEARCLEAGMDGCLVKPVEPERLLEAMARLLPPPAAPAETEVAEVAELSRHPRFRPAAPPALDEAVLERLRGLGGAEFLDELAADFLAEGGEALGAMTRAATARDAARFRDAAHALASLSANIGAQPLHAACAAAQRLGHAELALRGRGEAEAIAAEFERVRRSLARLSAA